MHGREICLLHSNRRREHDTLQLGRDWHIGCIKAHTIVDTQLEAAIYARADVVNVPLEDGGHLQKLLAAGHT